MVWDDGIKDDDYYDDDDDYDDYDDYYSFIIIDSSLIKRLSANNHQVVRVLIVIPPIYPNDPPTYEHF